MNATQHAATGTYYPAVPGARTLREARDLYVHGLRVSATVALDGRYTVWAGTAIVAEGQLAADTEPKDVNGIAAREAIAWSDQIENELAEVAAFQLGC